MTGLPATEAAGAPPALVVVDDDVALAHAVKFAFELDGYAVTTFASGEALLQAGALPARGCLVLDLNLPGMDGLQVLEALRARGTRLPAVLITSNPGGKLKARARRAGVPIIEKPLLGDALLETVQALAPA